MLHRHDRQRTLIAVSASDKIVPDRAKRFYDPRTGSGVATSGALTPVVHECGFMTLDRTWRYRDVCSPFWRAYLNMDRGAAVAVVGKKLPLLPGRVAVLPAGTVYSCVPKAGARHLWIHFSLPESAVPPPPSSVRLSAGLSAAWLDLAARIAAGKATEHELHAICTGLLLLTLAGSPLAAAVPSCPRWRAFVPWVESRLSRPPSLREMAAHAGMSTRTFQRWFHQVSEATPADWLLRRRIREACRLLRFGKDSVEQIAAATGFANRHHFTRAFTAETGISPAAYRKQSDAL